MGLMKTILISGIAGFIFSRFANLFKEYYPDWTIVGIDSCTYASDRTRLNPNVCADFFAYDVSDVRCRDIFLEYKPDVIVHAAAESDVDRSISGPLAFIDSNVRGTASMLNNYRKYCPEARYISVSTDETLGSWSPDKCKVFINSLNYVTKKPYDEDQPLDPTSPYASSKASAELITNSFITTYNLANVITVRPTNCYGPTQKDKLIPTIINKVLNNQNIPIFGQGDEKRDFLYVDDLCEAIEILCLADKPKHNLYHVSGGNEHSNLQTANDILTVMGRSTTVDFIENPRGNSHDFRYFIDSSRFRNEFGWSNKTDWFAGLKKTIDFHVNRIQ